MRRFPGLAPLRERDFTLYWFGQVVSQSGTWIELTTTSWLLYELTRSPVLLGLAGLFRAGPIVLLSIVGGAVADRVPRRRLLVFTQSAQVVTSLLLGTLVATGTVAFWHIYLVSAVNATLIAFDTPARLAMFPNLVPRGQLQNAVALNSILFRLSTLVGPAVAGTLIVAAGVPAPYFVNAASYFAIIGALLLIRTPDRVTRSGQSLRSDAIGGIRYALASPILPLVLAVEAALNVFGYNSALLTVFARDILGVGAQGLGLLLSAVGAGAIVGTVSLVLLGDVRKKGLVMLAAGVLYAAAMLLFAWSRAYAASAAILFCLGLADAVWGAMRNTIAQLAADDAYRGRVMSLIIITTRGFTQVSQVQIGISIALFGAPLAATLGAAAVGATVLAVGAQGTRLRSFESTRSVEPTAAEAIATPSA